MTTMRISIKSKAARLLSALLVPLAIGLAAPANAAFIDFSGSVTDGMSFVRPIPQPFSIGDAVTGFIELNDDAVAPGGIFNAADLLDFSFTVGAVTFDLNNGPFVNFGGRISSDGMSLSRFGLMTAFNSVPQCRECALILTADGFMVTVADLSNVFNSGLVFGSFDSTLRDDTGQASVAEPAPLALFAGITLLLIWGVRRRQSTGI